MRVGRVMLPRNGCNVGRARSIHDPDHKGVPGACASHKASSIGVVVVVVSSLAALLTTRGHSEVLCRHGLGPDSVEQRDGCAVMDAN